MVCPHCGERLQVKPYAFSNADSYRNIVVAKTDCCGKGVRITPRMTYIIEKASPDIQRDGWGRILVRDKP